MVIPLNPMDQAKPPAKTSAERQAELRRRRQAQGREQTVYWLTADEQTGVKAFLAGELREDSAKLAAERDSLTAKLEKSREVNNDLNAELTDYRNEIGGLQETTLALQRQLLDAVKALKEKPA